ncbi:hypothetical protein GGF31_002108 [Allomyces arbusculus]|nr:hypothetical protein GGF31_002108 [Allomyces arbusculus]
MTTFLLPLVHWRPHPLENDVTCLALAPAPTGVDPAESVLHRPGHLVVAGTERGNVWVFRVRDGDDAVPCLAPHFVLTGHTTPVTCIAFARQTADVGAAGEERVVLTASEDGLMCLWDLSDGHCLNTASTGFPGTPRALSVSPCGTVAFLGGEGARLLVLDGQTLEVLASSSEGNDWTVQVHCLSQAADQKVYLLVLTPTCLSQLVYDVTQQTIVPVFMMPVAEQVDDPAAEGGWLEMSVSADKIAVVGRKAVMLFDWSIGKIQRVGTIYVPKGEAEWASGQFLSDDILVLSSRFNNHYFYDIRTSLNAPLSKSESQLNHAALTIAVGNRLLSSFREDFEVVKWTRNDQEPPSVSPTTCFSFTDFWPTCTDDSPPSATDVTPNAGPNPTAKDPFTCQLLVSGRIVLAGTSAGYLQWHPLDQILTSASTPTPPARIHAHHGPVTCLAAVPIAGGGASQVVATGGHDTTVRLWAVADTDSGSFTLTALHTFRHGIAPVVRIVPGPDPGSIVTIAADHAVAVLDVASRALVLHLPGPAAPPGACAPSHIAWRDEYVLVVYAAAGLIYVWDRVAGALERVLRAAQVGDLVEWAAACDKWLDLASAGASGEFGNAPTATVPAAKLPAVSLRSLESSHVLVVNLKRVVAEGARDMPLARALVNVLLQRGVVPELDALIAGDANGNSGSNDDIVAVVVKEGVTLGVRGANGNLSLMTPRQQGGYAVSPTVTSMRLLALYLVTRAVLPTPPSVSVTASMDRLAPTPPETAPAVTPTDPSPGTSPDTPRGTRRSQLGPAVDDDPAHQLLARYLHSLPDAVGPAYCPPSLAFLARYWRDSLPALQQGARRLLVWSVQNMPRERQAAVVHYWHSQLPVVSAGTGLTKTHARATVISAVLACDVPQVVSLAMAKDVALSLVLWMGEDEGAGVMYRQSAIELLGRGFARWEPHLNAGAVVRTLIWLGMQLPPAGLAQGAPPAAAVASASTTTTHASASSATPAPGGANLAVAAVARQTLLAIAHHNLALVVQTIVTELEHTFQRAAPTAAHIPPGATAAAAAMGGAVAGGLANAAAVATANVPGPGGKPSVLPAGAGSAAGMAAAVADKILVLRFVSYLVYKAAAALAATGLAARLAEAVVHVLDPATPLREALTTPATATLYDLVRRFPGIAFHGAQQRLAVGGPDGRLVVWDLRTAARIHVVDAAHPPACPVTAVAFSIDGKAVVSYSLADHAVKVWQAPSGLLFLMGAAVSQLGVGGGGGGGGHSGAAMRTTKLIGHPVPAETRPLAVRLAVVEQGPSIEVGTEGGKVTRYPL